jgi:hypothetical protein
MQTVISRATSELDRNQSVRVSRFCASGDVMARGN